jgi:hypothetical protein
MVDMAVERMMAKLIGIRNFQQIMILWKSFHFLKKFLTFEILSDLIYSMKEKLDWKPWTKPEDIPVDTFCLFKLNDKYHQYEVGKFKLNASGNPLGTIGGRFYFDWEILEWAVIEDII